MATDSVVGAVGGNLSDQSKAILAEVVALITGTVAYVDVGGAKAVYGTESQGVIAGALPPAATAVTGVLKDTNFVANVELPAGVGVNFKGPSSDVSVDQAVNYFKDLITAALPSNSADPTVQAKSAALQAAVNLLKADEQTAQASVRVIEVAKSLQASAAESVKITGTGNAKEIVAINTSHLAPNQKLILQDLEKVILVNKADVVVTGDKSALVVGDNADQKITGGQGADTLVGGGGSDTLVGGAGSDSFGFVSGGQFQIGDFNPKDDKFAFDIPGVHSIQDLVKLITKVDDSAAGVSYTFGNAGTITLVGVKAADITADMIKFTIGSGS